MRGSSVFKIILIVWAAAAAVFTGAMIWAAWDYNNKCVSIDPKDEIEYIYAGESYAAEDLFNLYRVREGCDITLTVTWTDGTTDGIDLSPDADSFTVTEGTGIVNIHIGARNPGSPEGRGDDISVRVEERGD